MNGLVAGAGLQPGVVSVRPAQAGAQVNAREVRMPPSTLDLAARADLSSAFATAAAEALVRPQDRTPAKSSTARDGGLGDGTAGFAAGVNARADAPYQIEASAAAVPDTAIAETVSAWVTQGVQSAELTLDGFGNAPVEVRISLNGDQAQVDFRSDQADVREALEAASAQLRDLLSGEGLQLTGVFVGSSGQRNAQGEARPQPNPTASQTAPLAPEPVAAPARARSINPSVGQALDLFV